MKIKITKHEIQEIIASHPDQPIKNKNPYACILVAGHIRHKQTIFTGMASLAYFRTSEDLKKEYDRILIGEESSTAWASRISGYGI